MQIISNLQTKPVPLPGRMCWRPQACDQKVARGMQTLATKTRGRLAAFRWIVCVIVVVEIKHKCMSILLVLLPYGAGDGLDDVAAARSTCGQSTPEEKWGFPFRKYFVSVKIRYYWLNACRFSTYRLHLYAALWKMVSVILVCVGGAAEKIDSA